MSEQRIRESETRYRELIELLPQTVFEIDAQGKVLTVNSAGLQSFGYSKEDLENGLSAFRTFVPNDHQRLTENIQRMLQGELLGAIEYIAQRKDGSTFPVITYSVPIVHENTIVGLRGVLVDITDRKRAEDLTRATLQRFETLISNLYAGVLMVSEDGIVEHVNQALCDLYHLPDTPDSLRGLTSQEIIRKIAGAYASSEEALDRIRDLVSRGNPVRGYEIAMRDGRTVMVDYIPILDRDGKRHGRIWHHQDITEHKQVEDVLRKSESRLKRAEEVGRSGSWEFRLNENAVEASGGARILYGLGESQWTIDEVQQIPLPEYRPLLDSALKDLISGKSPYNIEFKIRRRSDGAVLDIHSLAEYDPGQNIVFGVIHDITRHKQGEQALRESEEKYRSTLDALTDAVTVIDRNFTFTLANTRVLEWLRALGQSDDVIGKQVLDAFPFLSPSVIDEYRTVFSTGTILVSEESFHFSTGDVVTETRKIPVVAHGDIIAVIAVIRDITERKQSEESLRQANRKLNLLNNITRHDIRNTLFGLDVYLLELQKSVTDPKLLNYIAKSINAVNIVTDQIEFTRQYQSLGEQSAKWQDVRPLLSETPSVKIHADTEIAGLEIFADPMLRKVFDNLSDNAVRDGERVTEIRIRYQRTPGGLTLVWEDNGVGIPVADKERIFERGFGKNTGLGLFLVREILGITGITIRETGEPGNGARFEILVPDGRWRIRGEMRM